MEFHIRLAGPVQDIDAIEWAIRVVDPSALVDIDPAGGMLRVAASLDARALLRLIDRAGYPAAPHQLTQVPSICCGGCSG